MLPSSSSVCVCACEEVLVDACGATSISHTIAIFSPTKLPNRHRSSLIYDVKSWLGPVAINSGAEYGYGSDGIAWDNKQHMYNIVRFVVIEILRASGNPDQPMPP